jgi:hypothetical protein
LSGWVSGGVVVECFYVLGSLSENRQSFPNLELILVYQ